MRSFYVGLAIGAFLMMLVGCCAPVAPPIDFQGNWTDAEKAQIQAGFAEWDRPLSVGVRRAPAEGCEEATAKDGGDVTLYGKTLGENMCLWPARIAANGRDLQQVAAHEYGHRLGLPHDDSGPQTIMRRYTKDQAPEVTEADREKLP